MLNIELRPVLDENGLPIVHDIYIDGVWHGSRRTVAQCNEYTDQLMTRPDREAAAASATAELSDRRKELKDARIATALDAAGDLSETVALIREIVAANPDRAAQFKSNTKIADWFVGQVLKRSNKHSALVVRQQALEILGGLE